MKAAEGLLEFQLRGCGGVLITGEADPVGLEVGGELVGEVFVEQDGFVGHPVVVAADVDLDGDFCGGR